MPTAGTCGNYVEIPNYKTEEVMTNCILIAIRLCGEIDNDGGGDYGSEDGEREEEDREAEVVNDNSEEGNFSLRNYALEGEEEDEESRYSDSDRSSAHILDSGSG